LIALIQLTRSGNTKRLRNAFGNSTHNRPIAAPLNVDLHRPWAFLADEGHNRRHMLGADQGAAAQVDDVDIFSGNQTQCSQRLLARDTPWERDLLHQAHGAFQRVHPFPRDPAPADEEDKVHKALQA
jgi:hypothetical protein